jgi:peptidoglycan/xylan/chitin deacetylase (PgdA/CDA1 family)
MRSLLDTGRFPPKAVCITFDDGYSGTAEAADLLRSREIPMCVAIPGMVLEGTRPSTLGSDEPIMSPSAIRDLHHIGVDIVPHGYSHRPFATLSDKELDYEIERSLDTVSALTGKRPRFYVLPFGSSSLNAERRLKRAGVEVALTIRPALLYPSCHPLRVPRFCINSRTLHSYFLLSLTHGVTLYNMLSTMWQFISTSHQNEQYGQRS